MYLPYMSLVRLCHWRYFQSSMPRENFLGWAKPLHPPSTFLPTHLTLSHFSLCLIYPPCVSDVTRNSLTAGLEPSPASIASEKILSLFVLFLLYNFSVEGTGNMACSPVGNASGGILLLWTRTQTSKSSERAFSPLVPFHLICLFLDGMLGYAPLRYATGLYCRSIEIAYSICMLPCSDKV